MLYVTGQTELRSKILTKIGPQNRIVFQIGRLIAEGYQLSGACPHRHEVPHPNVPCAIQQRIGDTARRQRREQRLCVGWIKHREESGEVEYFLAHMVRLFFVQFFFYMTPILLDTTCKVFFEVII